jgi:peptide/nickel transport system substrate-binding protein
MTPITRRGLALAAAALAAAPRRAAAQPSRNVLVGGFDVGPGGDPGNFNPLAAPAGYTALNFMYEPLVIYTPDLDNIEGALATGWEVSADKTKYTFTLADNVHWQDGQKFSASDVAFTIGLAQDTKTGSLFASSLSGITVATPDAKTVLLTLARPNASLPALLSKLMMLPRHELEPLGRDGLERNLWWSKSPVGTGPFQLIRYEAKQYGEYKAFAGYRLGKPRLAGLINRYFKDTASAVAALKRGEIEFSYVDPDEAHGFVGNKDFRILSGPSWELNYIGFNFDAGLWGDVRVRQAFLYAINRAEIVKTLFHGTAEVANTLFVAPELTPDDLQTYPFDPPRARALLAAAGWGNTNGSKPLPWLTYYDSPLVAAVMAAMQATLAEVGVVVVPRVVDVATYNSIVYAQKPDPSAFPLLFAGAQNGPDPAIVATWTGENQVPPNGTNVARIRDPALDAAIAAAMAESDDAKRLQDWRTVAAMANRELPVAPLWVAKRFGVVTANVKNFIWQPAPAGGPFAQHAELWAFG